MINIQDPKCDVLEIWKEFFQYQMKLLSNKRPELYYGNGNKVQYCLVFQEATVWKYVRDTNGPDGNIYEITCLLIKIWKETKLIEFYGYNSRDAEMFVSKESI